MPDHLEFSPEVVFSSTLIDDALAACQPATERWRLLEGLREQVKKVRAAALHLKAYLDALCTEAARRQDARSDELVQASVVLLEKQKAGIKALIPRIQSLERKLAEPGEMLDSEARALLRDLIDAGKAWIALYGGACERLLCLADERRETPAGALPARPVEGDIDYDALTHDTVARFPKILAALAK